MTTVQWPRSPARRNGSGRVAAPLRKALLALLVGTPEGDSLPGAKTIGILPRFAARARHSARFPLGLPATMPGRMWVQYSTSCSAEHSRFFLRPFYGRIRFGSTARSRVYSPGEGLQMEDLPRIGGEAGGGAGLPPGWLGRGSMVILAARGLGTRGQVEPPKPR